MTTPDDLHLGPKHEPGMDKDHLIDSGLNAYGRLINEAGADAPRQPPSPMLDYIKRKSHPGKGGYRPGAGLKKGAILVPPDMKRIPVQVRLPKFLVDWMYTQDISITKTVEYAVRQLMSRVTTK